MENKKMWVIGICNSGSEGVSFKKVIGTEEDVKKYLFSLIEEDRNEHDPEEFDFGTETVSEIYSDGKNRWYGFNCYMDSHVDFSAELESEITITELS